MVLFWREASHGRYGTILLSTNQEQLIILLFKIRINPQPFIFPEFNFIPNPYLSYHLLVNRAELRLLI